jgi:hypothetical protein
MREVPALGELLQEKARATSSDGMAGFRIRSFSVLSLLPDSASLLTRWIPAGLPRL